MMRIRRLVKVTDSCLELDTHQSYLSLRGVSKSLRKPTQPWTKGQIVGVVLTCTLILLAAIALGVWYYRRRQNERREHEREERAELIRRRLVGRRIYEAELERTAQSAAAAALVGEHRARTLAILEGKLTERHALER